MLRAHDQIQRRIRSNSSRRVRRHSTGAAHPDEQAVRRSRGLLRRVARIPASEARRRRSRLHRLLDGRAAPRARGMAAKARSLRHDRMDRRAESRSRHRARGDERARLRPSRAHALGARSRLLRHRLRRRERSAGARGPPGIRLGRAVEEAVSRRRAGRLRARGGAAAHPRAARSGPEEPHRQRSRPLGLRHRQHEGAERGSVRVRREGAEPARPLCRGEAREGGDRCLRGLARAAGTVQDRPLGDRKGQLRLVPRQRTARPLHLELGAPAHDPRARPRPQ